MFGYNPTKDAYKAPAQPGGRGSHDSAWSAWTARFGRLLALAVLTLPAIQSAMAASQTWDGGSTVNGNWSTAANWVGDPAAPGATSGTTNTDVATFNAAIANTWGLTGTPVVTTAALNIGGISFNTSAGNYFIGSTGGNAINLTSGGTIQILNTLSATNAVETINAPLVIQGTAGTYTFSNNSANGTGAGAGTLNFGGGITGGAAGATVLTLNGSNTNANTISGVIGNGSATTLALTKSGTGTWVLSGANTYTGATTINGGTLTLSGANGAIVSPVTINYGGTLSVIDALTSINSNRLSDTAAITMNGGTFSYTPTGGGSHTEAAGQLSISSRASTMYSWDPGGSGKSSVFTFASLARTVGATVNFTGNPAAGSDDNNLRFTTGPTLVNGIIGGYATYNGNDWATYTTATKSSVAVLASYAGDFTTTTNNVSISTSPSALNNTTINSLRLTGNATVTVNGGYALTLTSGGVLVTGSAAPTITGGTLKGAAGTDLVVHQNSSGSFTISSVIADNTSATGLTKSGTGTLIASGSNTYTGATTINAGTLKLGAAGDATNTPLGTTAAGTLVTTGAALDLNGWTLGTAEALTLNGTGVSSGGALTNSSGTAATYSGLLTLGSASSIVSSSGNIILTNAGTITGSGFYLTLGGTATGSSLASIIGTDSGTVTKTGTGTWTLSGANTFSGQLSVQQGTLSINTINDASANGVLGNSANSVSLGNTGAVTGTLAYTGGTASSTKKFTLATGGTGAFDVTTGGTTLTLSGLIDGSGALTKSGAGTLTLSGSNTYTGATTVDNGTLNLSGGSLGATAVTVSPNTNLPVLKVSGNCTLGTATGGTLTIGGGVSGSQGTLSLVDGTVNTLTLLNNSSGATTFSISGGTNGKNSILNMEVGATADKIALASTAKITIYGSTTKSLVNLTGLGGLDGSTQTLIDAPGGIVAGGGSFSSFELGTLTGNFGGYTVALSATTTQLNLTETANTAPTTAYWKGTIDGVWNNFTGGNTNTSNFATNLAGTNANGKVGSGTDVIFNATASANSANTTLGENLTIKTLTFGSNATSPVGIGGTNTLTITHGSSSTGVTVATGSGNHTLSTKIAFGAAQTWTVTDTGQILTSSNEISGGYGLTKAGAGTLILSGTNTYTGATTVSGGKLTIGSSGTINFTSGVSIAGGELNYNSTTAALSNTVSFSGTGGTLSGSGTITPEVAVTSGNTYTPGERNAAGTQALSGGISFAAGSIFEWDINTASSAYDKVTGGALSVTSGAQFLVASSTPFSDTFWNSQHTWSDIFGSNAISGFSVSNFLYSVAGSLVSAPSSEGYFTITDGGLGGTQKSLNWTAVPEPGGALAGLLLGAGLLRRKR